MKTKEKRRVTRGKRGGIQKPNPKRSLKSVQAKRSPESVTRSLPLHLPSLSLAYHLTQKAARLGFDWPTLEGVFQKLDEEMGELREALLLRNRKRIREEIGDLLFVMVNLSRFLDVPPEEALRATIRKFIRRFRYIETSLLRKGRPLRQSDLAEMDHLWEEAKEKRIK